MLIAWSMLPMKAYGKVALRAVADSLDSLVDMGGVLCCIR